MPVSHILENAGIKKSELYRIEKAELEGSLTLNKLRETAHAMGCDLHYAVVPRGEVDTIIKDKARQHAIKLLRNANVHMQLEDQGTTDEQMWDNLEYFLKRIVPSAEEAGVKLAMHPDDPPLSPMCGLSRIMRSVENFDRLLSIAPSEANGITLCQGCFRELGCDISEIVRHFADKINFVHFRDVAGPLENFHETFPDNGPTDMVEVFKAFKEIGYEGFIRSDHVPLLATEIVKADGYSMQGHIFAIGYMKGLMEPIFGRTGNFS